MIQTRRTVLLSAFALCALTICTTPAVAQNQGPLLLVPLRGESNLAIVDPQAQKVLSIVPTGEEPHEVALSADGKLAFVTNRVGGSLSIIDVAARKEIRRVKIGPGSQPHGIFSAAGKAYFTADGYKLIGRYDPAADQIDWMLGLGRNAKDGMLIATKDASKIFTTNSGLDNITVLELKTGTAPQPDWSITVIPVGKGPEAIDISPDGKEIWVAQQGDGGVSIIDVATLKVKQTFSVETKNSNRLAFTPDGKRVLISDYRGGELVVLDVVARKVTTRLAMGSNPSAIVVARDGSRAYVVLPLINKLAIVDLNTIKMTSQIATGDHPESMALLYAK